jgi:Mg2+/Co2+ transporter CorB
MTIFGILVLIWVIAMMFAAMADARMTRDPWHRRVEEQRDREMVARFQQRMARHADWSGLVSISKPIAVIAIMFFASLIAIGLLGVLGCK